MITSVGLTILTERRHTQISLKKFVVKNRLLLIVRRNLRYAGMLK